ncbi:radical SAM protein [Methanobrevibacter sp.]|uniref:radical SAM protein n=1 Tax=Methanobrevibacter sp. TaxID=66852 RepID=UPI00388FEE37
MVKIDQYLNKFKEKITKRENNITLISPQKETMVFDAVNLDTNNTCNQRCRFCFTSFNEKPINMDINTFKAVLEVLPLVKDYAGGGYGFYFSCIYEPTINPLFLEYLDLLPDIAKNKCFLTTNLAKPMDEGFIKRLLSANIRLVNISIESLKPERFEYITQNKKFNHYINNLNTLEKVINEIDIDIPILRFITILLKENKDEIIDLVKYTCKHFPIESHEIRTPFINYYENMGWNKKQYLSKEEVDEIITQLNKLECIVDTVIMSSEDLEKYENEENNKENEKLDSYQKAINRFKIVEDYEYLFLRINSDGTCIDKKNNVAEKISLENPRKYFKDKLFELYSYRSEAAACSDYGGYENPDSGDGFILVDKISENDAYIEFTGWCCPDRKVNTDKLIIKLTGLDGDVNYYHASTKKRFDADEFKEKEKGWCGGYTTYIDKNKLKNNKYYIDLIYETETSQIISYRWENFILSLN